MLKRNKRILYFYTKPTTFVLKDIKLLQEKYDVKGISFHHPNKYFTPVLFLKQLVQILFFLPGAQLAFCMFAGYHSFLPSLFSKLSKKPFIIILGGTESVVIPKLGYGILRKPIIGQIAKWSYKLTTHYAPVHSSLIRSENNYSDEVPQLQGIKNHVPSIDISFTEIPNGYDPDYYKPVHGVNKIENSFLTVAFDLHKPHLYKLKGVDIIIDIVKDFPECKFTIVGLSAINDQPENLTLLPAVHHHELIKLYTEHQFYFQLSLTEGFPNSLCEAMLCECIPIVSNVAAMPEIVDDTGFILMKKNKDYLKDLISRALNSEKNKLSIKARERIAHNYHIDQRKRKFIELIENYF